MLHHLDSSDSKHARPGALSIAGEIRPGFPFPWAGAMLLVSRRGRAWVRPASESSLWVAQSSSRKPGGSSSP